MTTTANVISSNSFNKEIILITLSSTTAASANIVLKSPSLAAAEIAYETIGEVTSRGVMGNPIAVDVTLTFSMMGLGETGDWLSVNELVTNFIAYIQIKMMKGQTITLNSGADDEAFLSFNYKIIPGEVAQIVEFTGVGRVPYKNFSIT